MIKSSRNDSFEDIHADIISPKDDSLDFSKYEVISGEEITKKHIKNTEKDTDIIEVPRKQDFGAISPDDGSVLVIILQCETKSCDQNITNLKWVFSDPYFIVQVCEVEPPPTILPSSTLTQQQYLENYYMRKSLNYAAEGPINPSTLEPLYWWTQLPVIIVKDSSVSNITPVGKTDIKHINPSDNVIGGMRDRIKVSLNSAKQADLFFLCKWSDACNKYVDIVSSIDHGSSLKWSFQPTATQAIMYTPSTRDFVQNSLVTATVPLSTLLNTNIANGSLLATVFVPNIIDFDISLATANSDYAKLNECAPVVTSTTSTTNSAAFVWFVAITACIFLIAWALIQLGPKYVIDPNAK